MKYDSEKEKQDLKLPRIDLTNREPQFTAHILLNVDGVTLVKSSNCSLWPVWLALANLPPVLRSSFKNLALASLWFGYGKPDWEVVVEMLRKQLDEVRLIELRGCVLRVDFRLVLLIADLPAKVSILHHRQFNGEYGCNLCYSPGTVIKCTGRSGKTSYVRIYEADCEIRMRDRASHLMHLSEIDQLQRQ